MTTEVLVIPEEYTVTCIPDDDRGASAFALTARHWGNGQWTVQHGERWFLTPDGTWIRDAKHLFDKDTALRLAREAAPHVTVNGRSVDQALAQRRQS